MQRRFRLRHASDFVLLREQGRRFHHPLLVLVVRENGESFSRCGFAASRHVGRATVRNRAKRLLREAVRNYLDQIAGGWDCLFIARRGAGDASFDEVLGAVGQVLNQAQLLNDEADFLPARQIDHNASS